MQKLASGNATLARFANYGAYSGESTKKPEQLFAVLMSFPGTGKSTFLESAGDMLRLDLDRAGTSSPADNIKAITVLKADDPAWGWDTVVSLVNDLCAMAKSNTPGRPKMVALDTVDSLVSLAVSHVLDLYQKKARASNTTVPESFHDLNGQAAWGKVYDSIILLIKNLRQAGYGVWLTSNLKEIFVKGTEDTQIRWDRSIPNGLWARIIGELDLVGVISVAEAHKIKKSPEGRVIGTTKEQQYILNFKEPENGDSRFGKYLKKRSSRAPASVTLPPLNGFQSFLDAYNTQE